MEQPTRLCSPEALDRLGNHDITVLWPFDPPSGSCCFTWVTRGVARAAADSHLRMLSDNRPTQVVLSNLVFALPSKFRVSSSWTRCSVSLSMRFRFSPSALATASRPVVDC